MKNKLDKEIEFWASRTVLKILALMANILPLRLLYILGHVLGNFVFAVSKKYRKITTDNLIQAFGNHKNKAQIEKIALKTYQNFTKSLLEFLRLPKFGKTMLDKMVSIEGKANLDNALANGKGAILLTAHFGNWELMGKKLIAEGYPLSVIARHQDDPQITAMFNQIRESSGYQVINRNDSVHGSLAALRANRFLGVLADQNIAIGGIFVDFFGKLAATASGPAVFALRTGANIVPTFIIRQKNNHHKIIVEPPMKLTTTGNREKDIKVNTAKFTKIIEKYVRKYPEQWFWLHQRWRTRPKGDALCDL